MARNSIQKPTTTIEQIIDRLSASRNVCDNRKAADLRELIALAGGAWRGCFEILRFGSMPEGGLAIVCRLKVAGLIWSNGQPVPHDTFVCALGIPNSYPLAAPTVQFLGTVPWCGHVVHRDFLPDASHLPSYLQEYRRLGHGRCCYVRSSQWRPDTGTFAVVLWQVSRLVSLAKGQGEAGSLNPAARDHAQRLATEGGSLPLGRALPYPREDDLERVAAAAVGEFSRQGNEDDVEWVTEDRETSRDVP